MVAIVSPTRPDTGRDRIPEALYQMQLTIDRLSNELWRGLDTDWPARFGTARCNASIRGMARVGRGDEGGEQR